MPSVDEAENYLGGPGTRYISVRVQPKKQSKIYFPHAPIVAEQVLNEHANTHESSVKTMLWKFEHIVTCLVVVHVKLC